LILTMPRPRPPHLNRQVTRHGKVVWYFRRGHGRKIRIRAAWGTPEFDAAYEAAAAGTKPAPRAGPAGGTLAWLFDRYCDVSAWTKLTKSTRYKRQKIMLRVLETAGDKRLTSITKETVEAGVERRKSAPSSAQAFVDTLHGVFKWALKAGHVTIDPTEGVEVDLTPKRKGGYPPWTDDDMAAYEAFWSIGTRERLLFDILCFTGMRIGDVSRLGRQHVSKGQIKIDTEKSQGEMRVAIPMLAALKATIDASPTGDLAFLVTRRRTPWNKGALGTYFTDSAKAAGIKGKSAHGMRKAAAIRSALNGATEREMEAIFGWKGGRMARLYAELASRIKLAENAIHTLDRRPQADEAETGTSIPPPDDEVGARNRIGE
jgi:integrase